MSLTVHRFAAIKLRQSGDDYYTVVCEMALIPKLFLLNNQYIPSDIDREKQTKENDVKYTKFNSEIIDNYYK